MHGLQIRIAPHLASMRFGIRAILLIIACDIALAEGNDLYLNAILTRAAMTLAQRAGTKLKTSELVGGMCLAWDDGYADSGCRDRMQGAVRGFFVP